MAIKLETWISINAPKANVWDALTNPEQVKKYFFGTTLSTTWEVGSPIVFSGEWEGKAYEDKGTVLEIEQEKKLKYNYWSSFSGTDDVPENYANIIYELMEDDDATIFTVMQDGYKSDEAWEHSKVSWQSIMKNLKELVENQ